MSQEKLLLCEDLHVVLVHEGGTGETGSFELTQLFAELLAIAEELLNAVRGCEGRPNSELRTYASDMRKLIRKITK